MRTTVSPATVLSGMFRPMSLDSALDPFRIKESSKFSPLRLAWTLQNRWIEARARREACASLPLEQDSIVHLRQDRGEMQEDTSVTSTQLELLLAARKEAAGVSRGIAEIGSYRGVTSASLAADFSGTVYAIDPFAGYGGSEYDLARFRDRTESVANIAHIRKTSGLAAEEFANGSIGMVFIDGVHDFSNSWFDFCAWSGKIAPGGMVAFHDVDDHPGVRLAVRNLLSRLDGYGIWAYCPNLIILRKARGVPSGPPPQETAVCR